MWATENSLFVGNDQKNFVSFHSEAIWNKVCLNTPKLHYVRNSQWGEILMNEDHLPENPVSGGPNEHVIQWVLSEMV